MCWALHSGHRRAAPGQPHYSCTLTLFALCGAAPRCVQVYGRVLKEAKEAGRPLVALGERKTRLHAC